MTGILTDIHRTSVVDGPGLRTTVFLKGCPLRCLWCHNPETQKHGLEPATGAGSAQAGRPFVYGKMMTSEGVVDEVLKDRAYYAATGGGVTVSGGEPLVQPQFAMDILRRCRSQGIHTVLDTSGFAPVKILTQSLECTDLYLYDFKSADESLHFQMTGVRPQIIQENLQFLISQGARVILRCPLVPGVNDQTFHLAAIVKMEARYPSLESIDILPWHKMGVAKYHRLGRVPDPSLPTHDTTNDEKARWQQYFDAAGCRKVRIL